MTDQEKMKALLDQAFAGVLATTAALLTVWKGGLSAERAAQLADFESKGLRLAIFVTMPADRWVIKVFMVDAAGETELLDTLTQAGALPSVN
jgi:hypothetical protein